jgi:hypothetical protein
MKNASKKLVGAPLYLVMLGMLIAGTANTVLTKWQNCEKGVPGIDYRGKEMKFTHPYVQSANMFLGEMLCLLMYGGKLLYLKY